MNKEVTITIRVEADLRSRFSQAAGLEHRPAAQVLRDLMREYVARARTPVRPPISAAERRHREEAVSYARASVGLEGFGVLDAYSTEAERFIRGEIDFPSLTSEVHEIARGR